MTRAPRCPSRRDAHHHPRPASGPEPVFGPSGGIRVVVDDDGQIRPTSRSRSARSARRGAARTVRWLSVSTTRRRTPRRPPSIACEGRRRSRRSRPPRRRGSTTAWASGCARAPGRPETRPRRAPWCRRCPPIPSTRAPFDGGSLLSDGPGPGVAHRDSDGWRPPRRGSHSGLRRGRGRQACGPCGHRIRQPPQRAGEAGPVVGVETNPLTPSAPSPGLPHCVRSRRQTGGGGLRKTRPSPSAFSPPRRVRTGRANTRARGERRASRVGHRTDHRDAAELAARADSDGAAARPRR
jgi:hypothetical protein